VLQEDNPSVNIEALLCRNTRCVGNAIKKVSFSSSKALTCGCFAPPSGAFAPGSSCARAYCETGECRCQREGTLTCGCVSSGVAPGEPFAPGAFEAAARTWSTVSGAAISAEVMEDRARGKREFSGPLTVRHIGVCAPGRKSEMSGEIRYQITGWLRPRMKATLVNTSRAACLAATAEVPQVPAVTTRGSQLTLRAISGLMQRSEPRR
jgi:hypothetical protein